MLDPGHEADAIEVKNRATNVIIDHCSTSYSVDELLSVAGGELQTRPNQLVTVQNCIIAWPLDSSVHSQGNHGFGSLIRGGNGAGVSYWRNLYAHTRGRAPRPGNYRDTDNDPVGLRFDFVNNVIYGWGEKGNAGGFDNSFAGADDDGDPEFPTLAYRVEMNHIANYYRGRRKAGWGDKQWFRVGNPGHSAYLLHNRIKLPPANGPITPGLDDPRSQYHTDFVIYTPPANLTTFQSARFPATRGGIDFQVPEGNMVGGITEQSVRMRAGASLSRDALDERLLGPDGLGGEYDLRTGTIIDAPADLGSAAGLVNGWPVIAVNAPPADSDGDGIPDEVEDALAERDPAWRDDRRNSLLHPDEQRPGHTALDIYLMDLVEQLAPAHW